MVRAIEVRALPKHRLWIRYADGTAGELDLSQLAGRGVFSAWSNEDFFRQVKIGEAGQISWSDTLDLCPDALYIKLTGRSPAEIFDGSRPADARA